MGSHRYFKLDDNCILVKGAKRSAIYDLNSGDVFSIDPVSGRIIGLLEDGKTLGEVVDSITEYNEQQISGYLGKMEENKLGAFCDNYTKRGELEFPTEPEDKLNFIWLELRENCNLTCRHCYSESESKGIKERDRLEFQQWKSVIQQAFEQGCRMLQFIGGEPLLYGQKLFDLAEYARDIGYNTIEVFSNLNLMRDDWIELLVKYRMSVATSIYSARPEIHDLITTREGSFDKTMKVVKKLKERNIPIRYGVTVMKHNQDYVEETMDFLKELGAKNPGFDVARPCGRANDDQLVPNKYQYTRKNAHFMQVDKNEFIKRFRGNGCWQGKISITSTGDVMPCIMQRETPGGNVKKSPLKEIVNGGMQKYWSLSRDKISVCKDCEYRYACRDCRPVSFGPTGQLTAKDPNCLYDPYQGVFLDVKRSTSSKPSD
jgi:radical SAM protein with 4Fe4S-binding SPASM domain